MNPPYPILDFDDDREAMIEPSRVIKRHDDMPERCVVCFFHDVIAHFLEEGRIAEITCLRSEMGRHPVYLIHGFEPDVALLHPGIGAPLAAGMLEETIALGGRKFIACGGAGTLDAAHDVGKLIVPTAAVRDEGTSYHYLPPGCEVAPTPAALEAIKATLTDAGVPFELTKTWTTDAFFRETKAKVQMRQEAGCGAVEMEAAALFAVARFRDVELAQILYAGDDLSGELWDSRNWNSKWEVRARLLELAATACGRL
jgi:uridine phosphorylase